MFLAHQLGRYHLLNRIASGGMAEIYRAKTYDAAGNEHIVAVKRLLPHLADDDVFLQMLVDEAKIATMLDHPNIAQVYEFVRCDGEYFLAMEYVDGPNLRALVDRCREHNLQLEPEHCAHIMICVLDGLHAAHERRDGSGQPLNIVHRDVSPSNVILSYDGRVKLCDFGIAKATLSRVQTRAGVIKGKVRYMSPEQTRGHKLDRRSDVFSAGTVLYELLTQQPAFQAEGDMELVLHVREGRYARASRYRSGIPRALTRGIRQALARSPSGRFPTARAFADALREYLAAARPRYRPDGLYRLLGELFAEEIALDRRILAEYEVATADPAAVGDNLVGDTDDPRAVHTKFTPVPGGTDRRHASDVHTAVLARTPDPETRLPPGVSLHEAKTRLHDSADEQRRIVVDRKRRQPSRRDTHDTERITLEFPEAEASDAAGEATDRRPDNLHEAETKILDREDTDG